MPTTKHNCVLCRTKPRTTHVHACPHTHINPDYTRWHVHWSEKVCNFSRLIRFYVPKKLLTCQPALPFVCYTVDPAARHHNVAKSDGAGFAYQFFVMLASLSFTNDMKWICYFSLSHSLFVRLCKPLCLHYELCQHGKLSRPTARTTKSKWNIDQIVQLSSKLPMLIKFSIFVTFAILFDE